MIKGKKVMLRAWGAEDLGMLRDMRNDLSLQRQLMAHPRGNSLDQVREWLAARSKSSDGVFLVIVSQPSGEMAGYIQAVGMDLINGIGSIGICIAPGFQGKGYGGEAMALLESYLKDIFGIRKLMLEVLAENAVAIGMYIKHGYREVGRLQQHFYSDGEYADVVIMEKLTRS